MDKISKKGGILIFHDTDVKGVKKFLDESVFSNKDFKFIVEMDFAKVFQKIK